MQHTFELPNGSILEVKMKSDKSGDAPWSRPQTYELTITSARSKIKNTYTTYQILTDTHVHYRPIDSNATEQITAKLLAGYYDDAFIVDERENKEFILPEKSEQEHQYTSTGIKFWRHRRAMESYKHGVVPNRSVVSTHISPEGSCNLRCAYCSVTHRNNHSRLPLTTIQDYVLKLKTRGLKAVILTGGGEPTSYKHFNELVRWLHAQGLSVALITNGTLTHLIADDVWGMFTWIRVSINVFNGWASRIMLPLDKIDRTMTKLGCSMVYTPQHEYEESPNDTTEFFRTISAVADRCGAEYIRVLPNCLLSQDKLLSQHHAIDTFLKNLSDKRYFHQYKVHGTPKTSKCHQSFFRPYLSEEINIKTGKPGTVYPCDSVVLNNNYQMFAEKYQLCAAEDILSYLDGKLPQQFNATSDCTGCVFTENVNMLDDYVNGHINKFDQYKNRMVHEEFI